MSAKISFQAVSRRFAHQSASFLALDRLSVDVADGEFVTLVGPSGCGKSTALAIAAGLIEPTGGEMIVDGRNVRGPGPERGVIFLADFLSSVIATFQGVDQRRQDPDQRRARVGR